MSDAASLPFVFSNLTNIVTANYFNIGFLEYLQNMIVPYIVSTAVTIAFLWLVLRRDIPKEVDITLLKNPDDVLKNKTLFRFSWFFLALLLVGYFIGDMYGLPVSVFALGGGLLFLAIASYTKNARAWLTIKTAPWQVVWFSIGLYIMIMDIALVDVSNSALVYANIIGCNLGPKMTPFGSLATLLWLHVLSQKGVKIGFWQYSKFGMMVTPPILFIVLVALYLF